MGRNWNYGNGREAAFLGAETVRSRRESGLPMSLPCPADFEVTFLKIGRFACREHYQVGRATVDRWLTEHGKERLIEERARLVREKIDQRKADRLTRRDMAQILAQAIPLPDKRYINPNVARRAARYLRIVRNGGFIISPAPDGSWWVGSRRRSAHELVELAKAKGFNPSLTSD